MFLIFASLVNAGEKTTVKANSVLELQMEYPVSEYTGNDASDPFAGLFEQSQGLDEILHAIQIAKDDDKIKGISINSNFLIAGISQTQAIRNALKDFRATGKFVYAYADFYQQKDYYLASVADSVFLNPMGALDFKGLSAEVLFFKELQEKSGIKMEVIRHGKYKSAVEPYISNEMSEANRNQIGELISALWNSVIADISEDRDISIEDLNAIADSLGGRKPSFAKITGLIDNVVYYDEYEALLKRASGVAPDEDQNYITLSDYMKVSKGKKIHNGDDKIAIVFAQGEIFYGEGGPTIIGQEIINEALKEAREREDVKAIVLRVNSPGGSALTSDIIWREIEITKKFKPVVASFGDVAASGGYYIAAGADKIIAEPTTITGSIGVFGAIPNISEFADDIGINAEQVGTNENAVAYSFFEPMSEEFREVMEEGIEATYETFLTRVAKGRNMSIAEVDSIAQGRVWSGIDAKRLGLVDELGGLQEAIEEAATLAGIDTYGIRKYPKYKSGFARLMEDLEGASSKNKERLIREEVGPEVYGIITEIRSVIRQKGIQARMPYTLTIQ